MKKEIEPGLFLFNNFDEVRPHYEQQFESYKTRMLYKIRNWRERFHPEVLTKGELYFSRPNELNDPFDIHTSGRFDPAVIDDPRFLEKLIELAPAATGALPGRDAEIVANNKLEEIRPNPTEYFFNNYKKLIYNPTLNNGMGVLSLTDNPLDKQLWGYYGGGLKGFAIGYEPMELCEELFASGSFVKYTDEIPFAMILDVSKKAQHELLYQKTKEWEFESEFRFTRAIDPHDQTKRIHVVPPKIVKEIILGPRIQDSDKNEIIDVVRLRYPHAKVIQLDCDYTNASLYGSKVDF